MKKLTLLLCLLSSSVFAAETDYFNTMQKNLSNPELYKQHHITIIKEEKHRFLFIPYTKEVLVSDIHLTGTDTMVSNQTETSYVASITNPIMSDSFEKTWTDSNGVTYKLKYSGEKTLAKS